MLKAYALRFHRWITFVFALPLLVVIGTGLVLSVEPLAQRSGLDQPLTKGQALDLLRTHDPDGKATGLTLRAYENALTIAGIGPEGELEIDLATGQAMVDDGGFAWSEVFRTARRMHETLLLDLGWVVTASTWAMLALAALGLLMGWPRLRNTLGGWHVGAAWGLLPLVILSPLTGLALVYGVTFTPPQTGPRGERIPIAKAVEIIADKHDLANMTSLRVRGGRMVARIFEDGALNAYVVRPSGLEAQPRNWPRALHEGNWSGWIGPLLNLLLSIVFIGLLFTGLLIWTRRTLRMRRRKAEKLAALSPAE